MFRERMSCKQLLAEYRSDYSILNQKTLRFLKSEYVNKNLIKHRNDPGFSISKVINLKNGNQYLSITLYYQEGKGKQKYWRWFTIYVGLVSGNNGLSAIAFYDLNHQTLELTPHFFERYKERYSLCCDWQTRCQLVNATTELEIMTIFFQRNPVITWINTGSFYNNREHIFSPINDGVALIQWDKRYKSLKANTFINYDMLDEKQITMVKYAREYVSMSESDKRKYRVPDFLKSDNTN